VTAPPPLELAPLPPDGPPPPPTRGTRSPRAMAWFGFRSFWGPLYHLVASVIATEDIDSRDWMRADRPWRLARRVARVVLGAEPPPGGRSLAELLERDLWVDFIADTGDDASVSEAVARLFIGSYLVPDPDPRGGPERAVAARGDLLVHGGDLAYPVATAEAIHDRFVAPWNRVLAEARDGRPRVLLGVPGNHDWYSGLDGFGRLFRRRVGAARHDGHRGRAGLARAVEWAGRFVRGQTLEKRRNLVLDGYEPVQEASYFLLPLARDLDLWGVDRQLRTLDYRQRRHFGLWRRRHPARRRAVVFPDPVYAHLEPSRTGVGMARALELDLAVDSHLCLAGDLHHYQRMRVGASQHVIAGGGGAFLHGARLSRQGRPAPEREWPGPRATAALLWRVPFQVMLGRAGLIPHVLLLVLFTPLLALGAWAFETRAGPILASTLAAVVLTVGGAFASGHQVTRKRFAVPLAAAFGLWVAFAPLLASEVVERLAELGGLYAGKWSHAALVLAIAVPSAAFAFGTLLAALAALGLESTMATTALAHPGFKHFVRMRVRRDGSRIDGWVIGLEDPLAEGARPVLVDQWSWEAGRRE
jgi:hypothetical protein